MLSVLQSQNNKTNLFKTVQLQFQTQDNSKRWISEWDPYFQPICQLWWNFPNLEWYWYSCFSIYNTPETPSTKVWQQDNNFKVMSATGVGKICFLKWSINTTVYQDGLDHFLDHFLISYIEYKFENNEFIDQHDLVSTEVTEREGQLYCDEMSQK